MPGIESSAAMGAMGCCCIALELYSLFQTFRFVHDADQECVPAAIGQFVLVLLPAVAVRRRHREVAQHAPLETALGRCVLARGECAGFMMNVFVAVPTHAQEQ